MKRIIAICVLALSALLTGCGTIETGNVGVRTQFGTVDQQEVLPGFYVAVISHVDEYSAKEIAIDLQDLKPRAKDNLTLQDLDVSVFYRVNADKIADLTVKYAGQSEHAKEGYWLPSYFLVQTISRGATYDQVSKIDSLELHKAREGLESAILSDTQAQLDKSDPGTFVITRVVIRSVMTDPSIEAAIRDNVNNQKKLEAKEKEKEIAKADAEIEKTRAIGKAQANAALNQTLTREYLAHEYNMAMQKCASNPGCVMIVGNNATPLINLQSKQ